MTTTLAEVDLQKEADMYCFKVPQLYNLKDAGFLGHGGSFCSVKRGHQV